MFVDPRPFPGDSSPPPHAPHTLRGRFTMTKRRLFYLVCLGVLLLSGVIGGWYTVP